MASKFDLMHAVVFSAVSGGTMLFRAIKTQRRLRKISDTPRSKVASAPQGMVEFEGFAWPEGSTVLTLDNEEAVFYSLKVQREEKTGSGKNQSKSWVTVFTFDHVAPFYLLDPTGVAMVVPSSYETELSAEKKTNYKSLSPSAKERLKTLVNGAISNFPPSFGIFGTRYRIIERKLLVGSPVYAWGSFKTVQLNKITIDGGLATFANKVIDFKKRSLKNVSHLLDNNKDGKVSVQEAIQGYATAAKLARMNPQKESAPLEVYGILSTCDNHQLFFADKHEKHLLNELGRFHKAKVVLGAGLVTAAVTMTLLQVGVLVDPLEAAKAVKARQQAVLLKQEKQLEKEMKVLHEACAGGQAGFCRRLVESKEDFQLSSDYIRYYRQRGCQLGETSLCETSPREVSSTSSQ